MCGIFGIIVERKKFTPQKTITRAIDMLFALSESRGKEASGIALSIGGKTHILKSPTRGTALIKTAQMKTLMDKIYRSESIDFPLAMIGHTRLATNGAWADNNNNQPISGNHAVIVHNGIIVNEEK